MFFYTLVVIAILAYAFLGRRTALGYHREIISRKNWWRRLVDHGWRPIVTPLALAIEFLISAFLYRPLWNDRKRRYDEKHQRECEEYDERQRLRGEESRRKAELRKQYFAEQPPVLYFNSISGITAVMTPEAYTHNVILTNRARRNGLWEA